VLKACSVKNRWSHVDWEHHRPGLEPGQSLAVTCTPVKLCCAEVDDILGRMKRSRMKQTTSYVLQHTICLVLLLFLTCCVSIQLYQNVLLAPWSPFKLVMKASSRTLEVLQVYPPVEIPVHASCTLTLMVHSFAFSYGRPYVGESSTRIQPWESGIIILHVA